MKSRILVLLCLALLVGAACGETVSPSAATVAGETISLGEVENALERFEKTPQFEQLSAGSSKSDARRQFEQGYLSQIIRRHVMQAEAEDLGIGVTQDEVDQRLEQIQADFPSEEEFEKAVTEQGLTLDQLNDLVRDQVLEDKVRAEVTKGVTPSDEELQSYYDENEDDFAETQVSHILVKKQKLAKRVAGELQKSKQSQLKARFGVNAKKYSEDPGSAAKGGDLGYFGPGDFVPEFEQAAEQLEIGEVSDPVRSEFGYHVIWVRDRRVAPFTNVREQITQQLSGEEGEQTYQDFIVDAYEAADVEVNPRFGELDLESQRIVNATAEDVPGAEEPAEDSPEPTPPAPAPTEE